MSVSFENKSLSLTSDRHDNTIKNNEIKRRVSILEKCKAISLLERRLRTEILGDDYLSVISDIKRLQEQVKNLKKNKPKKRKNQIKLCHGKPNPENDSQKTTLKLNFYKPSPEIKKNEWIRPEINTKNVKITVKSELKESSKARFVSSYGSRNAKSQLKDMSEYKKSYKNIVKDDLSEKIRDKEISFVMKQSNKKTTKRQVGSVSGMSTYKLNVHKEAVGLVYGTSKPYVALNYNKARKA